MDNGEVSVPVTIVSSTWEETNSTIVEKWAGLATLETVDPDMGISFWKYVNNRFPDNSDHEKISFLGDLGCLFRSRFLISGEVADIEKAIAVLQQAINLTPDGHADKPVRLNELASSFLSLFDTFGKITDIDKSIQLNQQAVNLTPDSHTDKPTHLNNLGTSFLTRFDRIEEVMDLEKSLLFHQQAVDLIPDGHANKLISLNNLGSSYLKRFDRFGEVVDLDKSILLKQRAVDLTLDGDAHKPNSLYNLGISFLRRFERFGEMADIDKSILLSQQAVDLTPDEHPDKPIILYNLGSSFLGRFFSFGEVTDINKSILLSQRAVDLTPDGHASKPCRLHNLGVLFSRRFNTFGDVVDIDKSILLQQRAVDLTPDGHAHKPRHLSSLGISFRQRFLHTNNKNDLQSSLSSFYNSATSPFGLPPDRLAAARQWAGLAIYHPPNDVRLMPLRACHVIMNLVPRVVWLGNSISLRYQHITNIGNAVNMSALIACATRHYDLALEWLEQGRSIVWGQILRLRTPMDNLKRDHPDLATSIENISRQLDTLCTHAYPTDFSAAAATLDTNEGEFGAQTQRRLAEEWERLLTKVRQCPGYRRFLQPKKLISLVSAAALGPVVFINIHENRSSAIILQSINGRVKSDHIELSRASLKKISGAHSAFARVLEDRSVRYILKVVHSSEEQAIPSISLRIEEEVMRDDDLGSAYPDDSRASCPAITLGNMQRILQMLWIDIVEPIFRVLGYFEIVSSKLGTRRQLPRVTWCTTGPLAFLPLHAAGIYNKNTSILHARAYNYAVSSYTPSLSMLLRREQGTSLPDFCGLTAVSQPFTPKQSPLPQTVVEAQRICNQLKSSTGDVLWLNNNKATRDTVIQQMRSHSWIHLACHGIQHEKDPMQSAFMLHDGPLDLRTISQQSLPHARLAFLSACQTAKGDNKLPEESAHLAAGMLMSGYHTVIGTMWSIGDHDAPIIAEKFYEYLKDHGMKTNDGEAAYALHEAVAHLREKVGEEKFLSWVPFIHLGI